MNQKLIQQQILKKILSKGKKIKFAKIDLRKKETKELLARTQNQMKAATSRAREARRLASNIRYKARKGAFLCTK